MTLWKTLRADGSSLHDANRVWYPLPPADGIPGDWIVVGGNGAYCTELGGKLFCNDLSEILVELETDDAPDCYAPDCYEVPQGTRCRRRVRVLRVVPWNEIPVSQGQWLYIIAREVRCLRIGEHWELVRRIPTDQWAWRIWAASDVFDLSEAQRAELRGTK